MRLIFIATALVVSSYAQAVTTYSYTGNTYTDVKSVPGYQYDTSMSISIEFTVADSFVAPEDGDIESFITSFTISDGINTFDQNWGVVNPDFLFAGAWFNVWFDDDNNITDWHIGHDAAKFYGWDPHNYFVIESSSLPRAGKYNEVMDWGFSQQCVQYEWDDTVQDDICERYSSGEGGVTNLPGTWAKTTVPVPAAAWLFGSALAGLGWMRRKQTH